MTLDTGHSPALPSPGGLRKVRNEGDQAMNRQTTNMITAAVFLVLLLSPLGGTSQATGYRGSHSAEYLYYIEGTGAYFYPDPEVDIFFSQGSWYRRSGTSWSVSVALSGPWGFISVSNVPSALVALPLNFRATRHFGRVPYRYVIDNRRGHDDYGPRYYNGDYYKDHSRRGYERRRHSSGDFWFFIAPRLNHDDRDDDGHRGRGRGRGRGRK